MIKPVKAIFRKMENGKDRESYGYYISEEDFNERNPTLFFQKLTKKTKPPVVRRDNK